MKTPIRIVYYTENALPFGMEKVYHAIFDGRGIARNLYDKHIDEIIKYHSKASDYSISTEVIANCLRICIKIC